MITTVLFDMDDTLYDQALPFKRALSQTLPKVPLRDEMTPLYVSFRRHCDAIFAEYSAGKIPLKDSHYVRINHFYQEITGHELSAKEAENFQRCYEAELAEISLSQEMVSLLNQLASKDITLGLISNGPAEHQWKKVRQLGLLEWFPRERIWISGAVGIAKPNPEIFRLVQEELGVSGSEVLYIGDSFENDIGATETVGWQSIWFNHRQRALPVGYQAATYAEQTVYDVVELTVQLKKLLG